MRGPMGTAWTAPPCPSAGRLRPRFRSYPSASFHGSTVNELTLDFHAAVDHYPTACKQASRKPQRPASGKVMLRIDPDMHTWVGTAVAISGESVNQWSEEAPGRAAHA